MIMSIGISLYIFLGDVDFRRNGGGGFCFASSQGDSLSPMKIGKRWLYLGFFKWNFYMLLMVLHPLFADGTLILLNGLRLFLIQM